MDLSRGYEAYAAGRRKAGSRQIPKVGALRRKLEREAGPVGFEVACSDPAMLDRLMALKSAQYHRTDSYDRFAIPWIRQLLHRLLQTQTAGLTGLLSILTVDGELAAAHFGLRSHRYWHYWFPAYERRFARFSPGLILLLEMAARAPDMGICRIGLGSHLTLYKRRLMSGYEVVTGGSIEV